MPARDLERALHEAIGLGISLFDVAAHPDSERLVGDAVRDQRARDRSVVVTRLPPLAPLPGRPARDTLPERLPAGYLQERVEASLRATRLDALPLVLLPLAVGWRGSTAWPELVGTCARLVREGKALAWGAWIDEGGLVPGPPRPPPRPTSTSLLGFDVADDREPEVTPAPPPVAIALLDEPWLTALSVPFNLCDRRAQALIDLARRREPAMPVLARQPLAGAALAGGLGPGMHLPPRDDRNELDDDALTRIAVAAARLSVLVKQPPPAATSCEAARAAADQARRPAHVECLDLAELALRFALDHAGIVLPRLHRTDHLIPAISSASMSPLSQEIISRAIDAVST